MASIILSKFMNSDVEYAHCQTAICPLSLEWGGSEANSLASSAAEQAGLKQAYQLKQLNRLQKADNLKKHSLIWFL